MIYVNLDQPYEDAVQNLKRLYAVKGNQSMIEHLVRQEAIRLGVWPQPIPQPGQTVAQPAEVTA